jgi:Na+/melibiose symporter-like transporter
MGVSLSFILAGLVLNITGFDANLGNNQPENTVLSMRILFCVIPATGTLTGLLLLSRYPLTRERVESIQQEIRANRAMQGTSA